jgi:hypothetical protein
MTTKRSAADTIGVGPSFRLPMSVSIFSCSARHLRVRAEVLAGIRNRGYSVKFTGENRA